MRSSSSLLSNLILDLFESESSLGPIHFDPVHFTSHADGTMLPKIYD